MMEMVCKEIRWDQDEPEQYGKVTLPGVPRPGERLQMQDGRKFDVRTVGWKDGMMPTLYGVMAG